jgi:hypothetical protein
MQIGKLGQRMTAVGVGCATMACYGGGVGLGMYDPDEGTACSAQSNGPRLCYAAKDMPLRIYAYGYDDTGWHPANIQNVDLRAPTGRPQFVINRDATIDFGDDTVFVTDAIDLDAVSVEELTLSVEDFGSYNMRYRPIATTAVIANMELGPTDVVVLSAPIQVRVANYDGEGHALLSGRHGTWEVVGDATLSSSNRLIVNVPGTVTVAATNPGATTVPATFEFVPESAVARLEFSSNCTLPGAALAPPVDNYELIFVDAKTSDNKVIKGLTLTAAANGVPMTAGDRALSLRGLPAGVHTISVTTGPLRTECTVTIAPPQLNY